MRLISRFLATALVAALLVSPLAAQPAQDAQKAAADAIRQLDLQSELPIDPDQDSDVPGFRWHLKLPPEISWIVLIGAVGLLIYFLRDIFPDWRLGRRHREPALAAEAVDMGPQPAAELVTATDELARQGRFVEAMHILLLQSLADIRQRLDERFADSLTSREILRSPRLSERVRTALREIIARVEWTYFGEHPAGPADYHACRDRFDELALALRGDGGA